MAQWKKKLILLALKHNQVLLNEHEELVPLIHTPNQLDNNQDPNLLLDPSTM
jgi:hypothetical protein